MKNKHYLKTGFSIYYATVHYEKQVYTFGTGLSFTTTIYAFSLGRDLKEAERQVLEKYDNEETLVKKVYLTLAEEQDINRYTFPEKMAGFSNAIQHNSPAVN